MSTHRQIILYQFSFGFYRPISYTMAKLEKSHFAGFVLLAATITVGLQYMGKELAVRYDRFTILVLVQLIAAFLSTVILVGYNGWGSFTQQASQVAAKHWGFIGLSALLGSMIFAISLHTLKTEKISDHGIIGVGAETLRGLIGGYILYSEGITIKRLLAVAVMLGASWFAAHV